MLRRWRPWTRGNRRCFSFMGTTTVTWNFRRRSNLIARLRARGVHLEQLVFPDEIHDFLLHRHWVEAYQAGSEFFDRQLGEKK